MGNVNRYRYGEENPVLATVAEAKVVAIGNIVGMSSNTIVNASDTTWDTDLATTQEAFHDIFLGVSKQASDNAHSDDLRVSPEGTFEFDCAEASFNIGDLVGLAKASGDALEDQKVVAVATENLAIGKVAEKATTATKVKVRIFSTLMLGGCQAIA